jgi:AmmeMemoRadiSam system protein B/AmmeMemoRadiSam system protein A
MNQVIVKTLIICSFSLFLNSAVEADMKAEIRLPAAAGSFYPGEPSTLAKTIAGMLAQTEKPSINGDIIGIIVPHAGYVYSGPVAAYAYKAIQGISYSDVIVVAPCHVDAFLGSAVYPGDFYRTPLGDVKIDKELSAELAGQSDLVNLSQSGHKVAGRGEHSLEVQLPFLQTMLDDFSLVAVIMGSQDMKSCRALAESIAEVCRGRKNVLLVASSDLSHFHDYKTASGLDNRIVNLVNDYNYDELYAELQNGKVEACGGGPIVAVMMASQMLGANSAKVVKYANSGDVTGDSSSVVGYLAAVISTGGEGKVYELDEAADEGTVENNPASAVDFGLSEFEKKKLLDLAYNSIDEALKGGEIAIDSSFRHGVMNEERGAFVTLTIDGNLRGCIGYIKAVKPLCETIAEMAVQAAFNDPRFPALRRAEFDKIEIEISVLTPMSLIESPDDVVVGRDGLYIIRGYNSGLLLPQVPVENNWDREKFLDQTCIKAGLAPGTWKKSGTQIFKFQADIFGGK